MVEKNQKVITLSEIRKKEKPMALFNEFTESGFLKTNYVCSSHTREKKIILKKVVYFWGSESYYKNDLSIDFKTYQDEIKKLKQ